MLSFSVRVGVLFEECSHTITYEDEASGSCPTIVTRVFTVTDACNQVTTCSQTITIDDTTIPSISCPNDVTIGTDDGECSYTVTANAITLLLQYDPLGPQGQGVPLPPSYEAGGVNAGDLNGPLNNIYFNTNVLPVGKITGSPTPDLVNGYMEFSVTLSNPTDLASVDYYKRSYFGTAATLASVRTSLDRLC
jgi:hypothetical protein